MAFYQGTFTVDASDTVDTEQEITGLGFRPTLVAFFNSGHTTSGAQTHAKFSFGASDGTTQFAALLASEHNQGNQQVGDGFHTDACVAFSQPEVDDGRYSLTSLDSDGFTLTVVDQVSSDWVVGFWATNLSDAYVGTFNMDTGDEGSTTAITGLGFAPDVVMFTGGALVTGNGCMFLGVSDGTTEYVTAWGGKHDADTTDVSKYVYSGECIAGIPQGQNIVDTRGTLTGDGGMDADGFTIDWSEGPVEARPVGFIAIAPIEVQLGDDTAPAAGGDDEAVSFDPQLVMFISSDSQAVHAQDTTSAGNNVCFGCTDGTSQWASAYWDQDALGTSDCVSAYFTDRVLTFFNTSEAIDESLTAALDTEKYTLTRSVGSGVHYIWYIAFGAGFVVPDAYDRNFIRPRSRGFVNTPISETALV